MVVGEMRENILEDVLVWVFEDGIWYKVIPYLNSA